MDSLYHGYQKLRLPWYHSIQNNTLSRELNLNLWRQAITHHVTESLIYGLDLYLQNSRSSVFRSCSNLQFNLTPILEYTFLQCSANNSPVTKQYFIKKINIHRKYCKTFTLSAVPSAKQTGVRMWHEYRILFADLTHHFDNSKTCLALLL